MCRVLKARHALVAQHQSASIRSINLPQPFELASALSMSRASSNLILRGFLRKALGRNAKQRVPSTLFWIPLNRGLKPHNLLHGGGGDETVCEAYGIPVFLVVFRAER